MITLAWPPWGAWVWAPQGIWWLPCTGCWGITTGRGLWPWSVQSSAIITSLFIGKVCWIFMGIKVQISSAQIAWRQIQVPTSNLRLLEVVKGLGTLHQAEEKQWHIFFPQSWPQKWANYLDWSFWSAGENQLITDAHCVKFNSKLLKNCKHNFFTFIAGAITLYSSNNNC